MKKSLSILVLLALIAVGCKKHGVSVATKNSTLYFAGADGNKAVYWKNGVEYTLPSTNGAKVSSVSVSGSDVYFVGFEGPGTEVSFPSPAIYWKNGVKYTFSYLNTVLNSTSSNFSSLDLVANVAFSGEHTYVGGTLNNRAVYWINGVMNTEPTIDPIQTGSYVNNMFLSGTDLYLAGYDSGQHVPTYWKNGVETALPLADTLKNDPSYPIALGEVNRICVSGPDVYCAGWDGRTLAYWKNSSEHTLPVINPQTTSVTTAEISGIALSGSDLYITGGDGTSAVYWKNGAETKLSSTGNAFAAGVAFLGTDIYIVGTDNLHPVYWKNGTEISLPSVSPGYALGFAVAVADQ
ncbi:MAG: hypothetical protein JWQ84_1194 [Mucilaginibacter sp.]|nr:hypothetical protein [Mucilaginibacter sp.]